MTVINPSSISGITSITMPSGSNVLTIHTTDGAEKFRIDSSGNVKVGSACTISQDGDVFFTGVTTATTYAGSGANLTNLPAANVTGTLPAISGANLTNLPAANLTGALPAISGANLTGIAATDNVRTGILDVAGVSTFRNTMNVGAAVTISESGIEASGIGITVASINGSSTGSKNLLINGAMNVAQRDDGTGALTTANGHLCDRWKFQQGGVDENATQSHIDVTSSDTGPYQEGFRKALKLQNGNQTSGAGAADYMELYQYIEGDQVLTSGWDYKNSNSKLTISMWVKSSVAQTFAGFLYTTSNGSSVHYMYDYVIGNGTSNLTADTWTKVKHTLPGNSNLVVTAGTGYGLGFGIYPFQGTDYTTSRSASNAWASWTTSNKVPDMTTTWYTTNNATLEITGVQLEVGDEATPYKHKHIAEEHMMCKRYFQKIAGYGDHYMFGLARAESNTARTGINVPVPMRTAPTVACNGHRTFKDGYNSESTDTPTIVSSSDWISESNMYTIDFGGHNLAHNNMYALMSKTTSKNALTLDAEL